MTRRKHRLIAAAILVAKCLLAVIFLALAAVAMGWGYEYWRAWL